MNWCKIMDGTSKFASNFFVKISILLNKSKFPELNQNCPIGPMIMERVNMTVDNKLVAMFPTGIYRFQLTCKYKNGDIMFFISLTIEII